MTEISLKQHKNILMGIMKFVDKTCRDNGIKYSLIGGTAIGGIRHKGFIPWDDDIDIILDHENYEKLKQILKTSSYDNYFLLDETRQDNYYPFMKLVDKRTVVKESGYRPIKDYGIFLDIFEYNNAPNNKILQFFYYYRIVFWKKMIAGLSWSSERKDKRIILFFRHLISKLLGKKFLIKHYTDLCHKYNDKECDYILSNWPVYKFQSEIQKKNNFKNFKDVEFENYKVMISSDIHEILTTTFGNYMQLPPVEKRTSNHNMKAYWKE